jgi:hypothetical protein
LQNNLDTTMTNEQKQIASDLFNRDFTAKSLIVAALAFFVYVLTHNPLAALLFSVLFNTDFDNWGFALTSERDAEISLNRGRYRAIQGMMQFFTAIAIGTINGLMHGWLRGILVGGACLVAWQFYVQDLLFFVLQKLEVGDNNFWLTRWGIYDALGSKIVGTVTKTKLLVTASVGLVLSVALCLL